MSFTAEQKAKEALREVAYRRTVYKRLVDAGKMSIDTSVRRTMIMQEIANDYQAQHEREAIPRLI